MVSTRSGSPPRHPPPPTPTSGTIPLGGGSPSASTSSTSAVPSSTSGPPPASFSLDAILQLLYSTDGTAPLARVQLEKTLSDVAQSNDGEVILSSFLQDNQGKPTIDPLTTLDPSVHTLGFLYILTARLRQPFSESQAVYLHRLLQFGQMFCSHFDIRQVSGPAATTINAFSHRFLALAKYLSRTSDILDSLLSLLKRWSVNNTCNLTAVHQDFVEACIISKDYRFASHVTGTQLTGIYKDYFALTYLDFLRYNYLAGIASAAIKDWETAEGFFESVVSTPATAASWIQIAAYKKLVLVQLIKDGKTTSLPKYVSASVTRAIKQHAQTYKIFAETFEASYGKGKKLVSSADKEIFVKDKNHGLVLQLVDTALSRQILKLTKTYEKLLVPEMAKLLGLEGAETEKVQRELTDEIFRMVSTLSLNASISYLPTTSTSTSTSPPLPIVTFLPPSERYVGPETILRLEQLNHQASELNNQVWHEDRRVGKSVKYLQKAAKEESTWGAGGAAGGGSLMGGMDEDLMESMGAVGGGRKTYDDNF